MTCPLCAALRHYGINLALWLDDTGSVLLGGRPGETISRRMARAREAGERWAAIGCAILTWIQNTIFRASGDHCTSAEAPGSIGAEVWDWGDTPAAAHTRIRSHRGKGNISMSNGLSWLRARLGEGNTWAGIAAGAVALGQVAQAVGLGVNQGGVVGITTVVVALLAAARAFALREGTPQIAAILAELAQVAPAAVAITAASLQTAQAQATAPSAPASSSTRPAAPTAARQA